MTHTLLVLAMMAAGDSMEGLSLRRTEHPRMLLWAADDAEQIYARIHDHPLYVRAKRQMGVLHSSNFEVAGRQLETKAATYFVARSQGFDRDLYRQAVGCLRTDKLPHDPWNGCNWLVVGQCLLLDALWNDMQQQGDAAVRAQAVDVVIDAVEFLNEHVDAHPWICCDYGNQGFLRMLPVYPAAILLRGHEPWEAQSDAWWQRLERLAGGERDWYSALHQMTRGGGGWPEGPGYHEYCGGQVSMVTAAIRSAINSPSVETTMVSPGELMRQAEYYFWTMLPGERYFNLDNGVPARSLPWSEKQFHMASYSLAGPHPSVARRLLEEHPPRRYLDDIAGPFILAYDPNSARLKLASLPRSRVFAGPFDGEQYPDGSGTVVWRSGWDESATVLLLHARNRFTGHQHADAASFYLFRNGFLVTENAGKPRAGSEHHNTYLIDGKGMASGTNPHRAYRPLEETPYDEGDILAHQTQRSFTYTKVAFGRSYAAKPDIAQRELLVLEPAESTAGDALIIVADRIRTRMRSRKTFLLHTARQPVINGETLTADDGNGRLFARILQPADASWRGEPNGNAYRNRVELTGKDLRLLAVLQASTTKTNRMAKLTPLHGSRGVLTTEHCAVFADGESRVAFSHNSPMNPIQYVICGMTPAARYDVSIRNTDGIRQVTIRPGIEMVASPAGVLAFRR